MVAIGFLVGWVNHEFLGQAHLTGTSVPAVAADLIPTRSGQNLARFTSYQVQPYSDVIYAVVDPGTKFQESAWLSRWQQLGIHWLSFQNQNPKLTKDSERLQQTWEDADGGVIDPKELESPGSPPDGLISWIKGDSDATDWVDPAIAVPASKDKKHEARLPALFRPSSPTVPIAQRFHGNHALLQQFWQFYFCLAGGPIIQQGDESGWNSLPLPQPDDPNASPYLQNDFATLVQMRLNHPALTGGDSKCLILNVPHCLAVLRRKAFDAVLIALNNGDESEEFTVPVAFIGSLNPTKIIGTGAVGVVGANLSFSLPAHGSIIIASPPSH